MTKTLQNKGKGKALKNVNIPKRTMRF